LRNLRRTSAALLALTLPALAALAACGTDRASGKTPDVLRIAGPFEIHSLAPAASSGVFTRLQVAETLVAADLEGELVPGLATGWKGSAGATSFTFDLPRGAEFHDGSPVTPEAVAEALTHARADEASPLAEAPITAIVPAADAVTIRLSSAYRALPAVLTHYSASILAPASYDATGAVTEVIGTGPYEIESVEMPATVETRASEEWRGAAPTIERVRFQAVGRPEARALLAASGQADIVWGLEPAGRARVEAAEGVHLVSSLQPRTLLLKVNGAHPALRDVRVRQALSLALDREAMADAVLHEKELAATHLLPPSLTAWASDDLEPLTYDASKARALLADAGWKPGADGVLQKGGKALELTLLTYPDRPELPALATAIQAALKEIGIRVAVDVANSSEVPAQHADGTLDIALLARHFALVTDPTVTVADTFAPNGSDWGVMEWSDDRVTRAVDQLLAGADGDAAQAARETIVTTAQEELPLIPVAWYRHNAAVADRVEGFVIDPLEHSWRLTDLSWAS
jgi:peptide/nickel transport system substrate-binding protein